MATVRYMVRDVDAVLPFYEALGCSLSDSRGRRLPSLLAACLALWLRGLGKQALVENRSGNPTEIFEVRKT